MTPPQDDDGAGRVGRSSGYGELGWALATPTALLLLASASAFWLIPAQVPAAISQFDIPPALVPGAATTVVGLAGLVLAARSVRAWALPARQLRAITADTDDADHAQPFRIADIGLLAAAALVLAAFWWLIAAAQLSGALAPLLSDGAVGGFEVGGFALSAVAMTLAGERRLWLVGLIAVAAPVAIANAAWFGLTVDLP